MTSHTTAVIVFAVAIYIITIPIAWRLLARLMALAATRSTSSGAYQFWGLFLLYEAVIVAPYAVLLLLGNGLPSLITNLLVGVIVASVLLSALRFVGTERTVSLLWWLYGWVYDGLNYFYPYQHLKTLVVGRVKVSPGMRVLDLGCGTGNVSVDLLRLEPSIWLRGVDNSRTMLARARRKLRALHPPDTELALEDLLVYLAKLPDASVDRVVMLNVVYAVPDRQLLWRESLRVLAPGGKIIATTSDRGGSKAIVNEHLAHRSAWSLLHPTLLLVGLIDYFISEMARTKVFHYLSAEELTAEVTKAGGSIKKIERCYGGETAGVNLLFDVIHA